MASVMFDITTGKGKRLGTVRGIKSPTGIGYYALSEIWQPDMAAIRDCIPYNWRKAFDRAGSFWFNRHENGQPAFKALYGSRRNHIATVYARGYVFTTELEKRERLDNE